MFARTDRLLLRPAWAEDAAALARALADEAVVRNLAKAPFPYTLADAEQYLARQPSRTLPSLLIFARTHRAPRLVGGIGLDRADGGTVELGYWIARPYWGLGFATEAGRAFVALAHRSLRIKRIVSGHFRDNPASGRVLRAAKVVVMAERVLRKLGFKATGITAPRRSLARRAEVPCLLFARDAADALAEPMRAIAA